MTIRHNIYKEINIQDFSGIQINDVSQITCLISLNLLCRLIIDMHLCPTFLLILLEIIVELQVHKQISHARDDIPQGTLYKGAFC